MRKFSDILRRVYLFYYQGFTGMSSWGRRVWLIIIIKLFIMFAILRIFFFPDLLKSGFSNDTERSDYVIEQITKIPAHHD
jgi:hypothetical protein